MSESRRIAVLLVRHDVKDNPPSVATCKEVLLSGAWSLARYVSDNTENWFQFAAFDFFGWYDIQLPPPPDNRETIKQRARAAAAAAGVDLSGYDTFVILASPGVAVVPNPKAGQPNQPAQLKVGYDAGADGIGPGHTAVLLTSSNHTFMCHELAHVLGFDHSYGIPNTGADWSDDGVDQRYPVYGDPYDLMSAASFGGGTPVFTLPASEARTGFPNARSAGPMLARAVVHYTRPLALELAGKVRHDFENGTDEIITLHPAGSGGSGTAELFVYHRQGEDGAALGRVYVEYRQPRPQQSRWDQGLPTSGPDLSRSGLVVHVVKPDPASGAPVVWYAGRIAFPNADRDVQIDTPFGPVTVSASAENARQINPPWVRVRINKGVAAPSVSIETPPPEDTRVVLSSEMRLVPGWEFAGKFTWERSSITRKAKYLASTRGFGGAGFNEATKTVILRWFIGNYMCMSDHGTTFVVPSGGTRTVGVGYELDEATGILTLTNDPNDGAYTVPVSVEAHDGSFAQQASAHSTFDAPGIQEGWGEDYRRFKRWFYHMTHPIPKWHPGPPPLGDIRDQILEMNALLVELEAVNPHAARALRPMHEEFARSQTSVVAPQLLLTNGRSLVNDRNHDNGEPTQHLARSLETIHG